MRVEQQLKVAQSTNRSLYSHAQDVQQLFDQEMVSRNDLLAAQAYQEQLKPLTDQRARLYEAFQKAWKMIDPVNPAHADPTIQKVMAAVAVVQGKAVDLAADVVARREQWSDRAEDFDDSLLQINELEQENHPKAAALRQLGEAIRTRANDRKYGEAVSALDQLRPKLQQIYAEYLQQSGGDAPEGGDSDREPTASEAVVSQVHDQIAAEHEAYQGEVNSIIQSYPVEEVAGSANGLIDGQWNVVDGLDEVSGVIAEGYQGVQQLDDQLKNAAKDVGVDLLIL